jgi:hypothetical protein
MHLETARVFPSFTALSVLGLMWLFKLFVIPLQILWCKVNEACRHLMFCSRCIVVHQYSETNELLIQFIKNYGPLHVSNITCSSSEDAPQAALGILCACDVSWLYKVQPTYKTHAIYQVSLVEHLLKMRK